MNSNDIRQIITEKITEEERTGNLVSILAKTFEPSAHESILSFINLYVKQTPDLLDAIYNAAHQYGLLDRFQSVFDNVFGYWGEVYDFIPDHLGLVGICDDAYLSLCLMQKIANTVVPQTSRKLFSIDIESQNIIMRSIIGEPVASQLDQVIETTLNSSSMQDALMALVSDYINAGAPMMRYMESELSRYKLEQEVNTQLGAMGIF